jgi:hypothetical protein
MMTMMGPAVPGDGEIPPVMRGHHQQGQDQWWQGDTIGQ